MKKLSICITCIIALVFGICGSAYSESGKWKKHGNTAGRGFLYQSDDDPACSVDVHDNGFFSIRASDTSLINRSEESSNQIITIGKTRDGARLIIESYSFTTEYLNGPKDIRGYDSHDIFGSRCVEYAKELPFEIQQLFYGFYGIGSE